MNQRISAILVFCLLLPLSVIAQNGNGAGSSFSPEAHEYVWPTDAGKYLTSTFAETRSAHFHSALDLKTWGRKGYKVFATRDGIVHRIAIGPSGYGKVIYLQHNDGSYSVYAHLMKFNERLQQLADSIRMEDYSFQLDRTIDSLGIHVKQGEVIGISGASGIGPPHLHFELRTPSDKPFNPLMTNLKVRDTIPPRFSRISVEPLSVKSEIEGKNRIFTKRVRKSGSGYTFGTIDVNGPVGLGVDVYDQSNGVHNAYAVYELKMYLNGELYFHSKADSFSYDKTRMMFIDRVYPLLQQRGNGYQRLYVAEGNTLPFYRQMVNRGKIELPDGMHNVRIEASDYFGNTSSAIARLRVENRDKIRISEASLSSTGSESASFTPGSWNWFDRWVNLSKKDLSQLVVAPLTGDAPPAPSYLVTNADEATVDLQAARDVFFRKSERSHFIARKVNTGDYSIVPSTTDRSFALFRPGTFYDSLHAGLTVERFRADSVKIEVIPATAPIHNPYLLAVELDSTSPDFSKTGLYEYNHRKEKLSYVDSRIKESFLMAKPETLGTFFVLSDTAAPVLSSPKPAKREDGKWLIYIRAEDHRSGIDYPTAEITVNGVRGIAEYEPEDDRLVYYHPRFAPAAQNTIHVKVADRAGNTAEQHFEFSFKKEE